MGIVLANILIGQVVKAYEKLVWMRVRSRIAKLKSQGLKVVAIAGSYGKTSVKHYAYELLRHQYKTVATPESYNTVMGIAKCLEYEVDEQTQVFIVEVGAYHIGDITYLLEMVQPEIGILTGIARQHLERFGSFDNIKLAKGEIAQYMQRVGGMLIANASDGYVVERVEKLGVKATWYGSGQDRNEINLAGAKILAQLLSVDDFNIKIRSVKNRFELTRDRYGMAVIDDSFSSNDTGFKSAVAYLGKQKKYFRILVTPGLVELGSESEAIHKELGSLIPGKADLVMLVGKNERTKALEAGIGKKVKVTYLDKTLDFMSSVKALKLKKEPLVLLENDVTENYN
jgi:UDP-N-acetylmuramoyl-tripeptide--D-alanyl-D-alanine ligase